MAKYEWIDETGLRHPSLVAVNLSEGKGDIKNSPIIKIEKIYSVNDYFDNGKLIKRKLPRIKGMVFSFYDVRIGINEYALFLGYEKKRINK